MHSTIVPTRISRQIHENEQRIQRYICGQVCMNSICVEIRKYHKPFAKESLSNKWTWKYWLCLGGDNNFVPQFTSYAKINSRGKHRS